MNAKGDDDETPLHVASTRNRIEVAKVLLAYGADIHAKDRTGKTPLDWAKTEKDEEMVALLQTPPARKTVQRSSTKGGKKGGFFGFLRSLFAGEDRSTWTLQEYAQAIANKVTNRTPCEDSGLEAQRGYIRTLGQEINNKFGFEGMQQAWEAIHRAMGPGPCSDLTRIWDGVGRWQKYRNRRPPSRR